MCISHDELREVLEHTLMSEAVVRDKVIVQQSFMHANAYIV